MNNLQVNPQLETVNFKGRKVPKVVTEIAQGMEVQFIAHLLKKMRDTIPQEEADSSANDYYKSLMDSERAKMIAQKDGGLGLQELIVNQLSPDRRPQKYINGKANPYADIKLEEGKK